VVNYREWEKFEVFKYLAEKFIQLRLGRYLRGKGVGTSFLGCIREVLEDCHQELSDGGNNTKKRGGEVATDT